MNILLKDISSDSSKPTEREFQLTIESLNFRVENSSEDLQTYRFEKPADVKVSLYKTCTDVYLTGAVSAEFLSICSRCAEQTSSFFSEKLICQFKPQSLVAREGDEEEDYGLSYHNGRELELEPFSLDHIMLNLPYSLLCSNECKGLCTYCGINLNLSECKCAEENSKNEDKSNPFAELLTLGEKKLH